MSDPPRLREDSESPLERALLEAGSAYRSSPAARAKTLAALGVGSATMSVAGVSAASSLFSKAGWSKLVTAVSVLGVIGGVPIAYYTLRSPAPEPRHAAAAHVVPAPAPSEPQWSTAEAAHGEAAHDEAAQSEAAHDEAAQSEAPVPAASAMEAAPAARKEQRFAPSPTPASAALTAELAALDRARATMARGDARGALTLLDAYFRAYPRGRLALEGEVMRIDALARAGQLEQSRQRAAAFLRRHPNSVLTSRVRGYLQR